MSPQFKYCNIFFIKLLLTDINECEVSWKNRIEDQGLRIEDRGSRIKDQESRIDSQVSRIGGKKKS